MTTPTDEPASLRWGADLDLDEPEMDAEHREFVDVVTQMIHASDDAFADCLDRFRAHAERHFGKEDAQMRGGYESAGCHIDEHAAVLASVAQVQERVQAGDVETGRRLAHELARWFPEHVSVMDSGLAAWLQKRRLGGAKIVFRRRSPG